MASQFAPLCMLTALLLIFVSVGPTGANGDLQATCKAFPKDQVAWTYFWGETCYANHGSEIDTTMSYFEAERSCNDIPGLEGHLAVFPDNFASLFPMMPYVFPAGDADFTLFLGLEQQKTSEGDEPDKNWFWVFPDGSRNPLPSGFWLPGQPNDPNGTLNYGAFMRRGNQFGLGNVGSSPVNGYVCQYDPVLTTGRIPSGGTPPPVTGTTRLISSIGTTKTRMTPPTTGRLQNAATSTPTWIGRSTMRVTTSAMPETIATTRPAAQCSTNLGAAEKQELIAQLQSYFIKINQLRTTIKAIQAKMNELHHLKQTLLDPISNIAEAIRCL